MTAAPRAGRDTTPDPVALAAPVRKLAALAPLSDDEVAFVAKLTAASRTLPARAELVAEGEEVGRPLLLLDGWACRQRLLADGRRQILGLVLPGDDIGLDLRPRPLALASVVALTDVSVADAAPLRDRVGHAEPGASGLAAALALAAALDEASLIDQLVRLGRQTAYERVAHLLLELRRRLRLGGLAQGDRFPLPLSQAVLADALGLSFVHINRTLQQLRREGLIENRAGAVRLLRPNLLATIADYREPRVSGLT